MAPDDLHSPTIPDPTPLAVTTTGKKAPHSHGNHRRALTAETLGATASNGDPGKFGRMFDKLPKLVVSDDPLFDLAKAMIDASGTDPGGDSHHIPAGFTYFGQFVDHDLTLDTTPLALEKADPSATENFRTPALDLDSLYADGPGQSPQLYTRKPEPPYGPTNKFLIGTTSPSTAENVPNSLPNDLPRNAVGRALVGDERNDENLVVAQTHLAFLKFHNSVVDLLETTHPHLKNEDQFNEARRIVTWHYQWIVLFDWVDRLTEPGVVQRTLETRPQFYHFAKVPFMPAEFSAAAYRIGHSMVRESYDYNRVFRDGGLTPATLGLLFGFTGKSGAIVGALVDDTDVEPMPGIPGGKLAALPGNWIIDWRRFFELDEAVPPNQSRRLDAKLAPTLQKLPGEMDMSALLAFRNLRRGSQIGLPSGQSVARAIGATVLAPDDIATGVGGEAAKAHGLHEQTPLWFYILKESEILHAGQRLGPVGSTIVAETMIGLVLGDPTSFLASRENWTPELPGAVAGTFTMADMLRFVGDINPIGEDT